MLSAWLIIVNINHDHLVEIVFGRFLHHRVTLLFSLSFFFFNFKRFSLFIHERERQRHRQRQKQAPYRDPKVGLDPWTRDHVLIQRQMLSCWATQASPLEGFKEGRDGVQNDHLGFNVTYLKAWDLEWYANLNSHAYWIGWDLLEI